MYELQLSQQRTDEFVIGIDPQLIDPMLDFRRHILVKQTQRAKCQRQQQGAFYEFENGDHEQSSIAAGVRSVFRRHYIPNRALSLSRTKGNYVSAVELDCCVPDSLFRFRK